MLHHDKILDAEKEVKVIRWYTGDTKSGRNYTMKWIAEKLGVSYSTIQRTLQRHNIVTRGKGRPPMRMDGMRRCSLCGETYKLSRFARDATKPFGRAYYCKGCNMVKGSSSVVDDYHET